MNEGQGRLPLLQQEVAARTPAVPEFANPEAEQDALRAPPPRSKVRRTEDAGGCSGRVVEFMPTLVPAELDDWMKDRQPYLQEALEFGEVDRALESTPKLSEAAVRMLEMAGKMVP